MFNKMFNIDFIEIIISSDVILEIRNKTKIVSILNCIIYLLEIHIILYDYCKYINIPSPFYNVARSHFTQIYSEDTNKF